MRVFPLAAPVLFLCACAHEQPPPAPSPAPVCPATWASPPVVPAALVAPDGSRRVVAHASAKGTQNYQCGAASPDGGSGVAWTFLGPEATLADCTGAPLGRHFASEGGASAPKWQAADGSFVVAKKVASEPSKEAGTVPALLLHVTASGGSGTLSGVEYVQRTATAGGAAPADGCDAAHVGTVAKVPYSADYWFLGR